LNLARKEREGVGVGEGEGRGEGKEGQETLDKSEENVLKNLVCSLKNRARQ